MDQAIELPHPAEHRPGDDDAKKLTGLTYSGGGFEYFGAASMAK